MSNARGRSIAVHSSHPDRSCVQNNRERWMELAEMAANEQDPDKLLDIIKEINFLLAQKQDRLNNLAKPPHQPKLP